MLFTVWCFSYINGPFEFNGNNKHSIYTFYTHAMIPMLKQQPQQPLNVPITCMNNLPRVVSWKYTWPGVNHIFRQRDRHQYITLHHKWYIPRKNLLWTCWWQTWTTKPGSLATGRHSECHGSSPGNLHPNYSRILPAQSVNISCNNLFAKNSTSVRNWVL